MAAIRAAEPWTACAKSGAFVARPGPGPTAGAGAVALRVGGAARGLRVVRCGEPVLARVHPSAAHGVVRLPCHKHTRRGTDGGDGFAFRRAARVVSEEGAGSVASGVDVQIVLLDLAGE